MKRYKNLTIIVLMTIFLLILSGKAEATTGKINTETARLREKPNTTSTILEQLNENDEVEILEEEDNWYKVKANVNGQKITGYVSAKLVDAEKTTSTIVEDNTNTVDNKTTETTPEVTTNTDTVKEEPLTDIDVSEDIKENKEYNLQQEAEVKILPIMSSNTKCKLSGKIKTVTILNDWCKIKCDTSCGWIRTNVLKKLVKMEEATTENTVVEQPASNQEPETSNNNETTETSVSTTNDKTSENSTNTTSVKELNKTGYVKVEGLTVRKGPSTSTEAIDGLSKNDKVEITGETDGWYQIKLKGEVGYVSAKYISDTKVTETTSRSGSTLKETASEEKVTTEQENEEPEENEEEANESTTGISGAEVVEYAKQYLGCKYVAGGASPTTGFDCSGFTTYVYKHFGISLNRSSKDQIKNGTSVSKSNLKLGDIIIFKGSSNTSIGHVGIYIGDNKFIHAANSKEGVIITSLSSSYYQKRYVGARRVI